MNNNQDNIKNRIRKYFLTKKSDIKDIPKGGKFTPINRSGYSQLKYKSRDEDGNEIQKPEMARALKALQLSNPFKGV